MLKAPLCVLNLQHTNSASYDGNAEKSNPHKHWNQMGFKFDYQVLLEVSCGFDLSLFALLTMTS